MKICFICEGSYPFVAGGVSSWLHALVTSMPQHEVIIWAIAAQEKQRNRFAYTLPPNVTLVKTEYLDAVLREPIKPQRKSRNISPGQLEALRALISCSSPQWRVIFEMFHENRSGSLAFLSSPAFLALAEEICRRDFPYVGFTDYFWTLRSMFLPLLYLLGGEMPRADLYHAVSAGYAGVLGAMASYSYGKPYVLTEHGIYTREREEEILRTEWVPPQFVDLWISMFYMFSQCAYDAADCVTALFKRASFIQQEIGCDPDKCAVIRNGIHMEQYWAVPPKAPDGWVDICAIVRIVPIKDIKTLLYAFSSVSAQRDNVRLHILGPKEEDEEYFLECQQLAQDLALDRVTFTGRVDVRAYLEKIDFTVLTSISEGQPLAVLEAMAAGRPVVSTDVGSCRELIQGIDDAFGNAGLCVPVMHQSALTEAILTLCDHPALRKQMGESGQKRVAALYGYNQMLENYLKIYARAAEILELKRKELSWRESVLI